MKILIASPEVAPFSKTGGLGDVAGTLPNAIAALKEIEVAVVSPYYRCVKESGIETRALNIEFGVPIEGSTRTARVHETGWPNSKAKAYFIQCDEYFDRDGLYGTSQGDHPDNVQRFVFFDRAVLELAIALKLEPDVLHTHDWQTGLIPVYLKTLYADRFPSTRSVQTVHNLSYQGQFPEHTWGVNGLERRYFGIKHLEFWNKWSFLKGGLVFADAITTVSPTYANEILTEEFGCGLHGVLQERRDALSGILNGVDYSLWDPVSDPLIEKSYDSNDISGKKECKAALQRRLGLRKEAAIPLVGMVTRLVEQKGLDIFLDIAERLGRDNVQFAILGSGESRYEEQLRALARKDPNFFAVETEFDEQLAHEIEAGADMFLMPSKFEPCGLNQIFSMRYGTVPVVRRTGGLADTIVDVTRNNVDSGEATGFTFDDYSGVALYACLQRALLHFQDRERWKKVMLNGMGRDFSWARSAEAYKRLYRKVAR